MGKIEDPLFQDRIILGRDVVKELVRDYTDHVHKGNYESAAEHLGVAERTLFAYIGGEKKSLPTEIFFSVTGSLGMKPEEFDYQRMSLTKLQKSSVKNWRLKNPQAVLDNARNAAPLSIVSQERKTGKTRKEIMQGVREGLYRKYGDDAHTKIAYKSSEHFKKKYGEDWKRKMTGPMFEALEKKHGKDWGKIVGANANRIAREMFGQNFQIEYGKIVYGDHWNDVIHAFQWQRENFQGFEEESLGPLFSKISEAGGYNAVKAVGLLLQNEINVEELSEKIGQGILGTRKIIHSLAASGIVHHRSFRAWDPDKDVIYADKGQLKQKAKIIKEENRERIISYLNEVRNNSASCDCGFRTTFENAFEISFHCPKCNSVLKLEEPKVLELVEQKMKKWVAKN